MNDEVKELRNRLIAFADKHDLSKMHLLAAYKSIADHSGVGVRKSMDILFESLGNTTQRMAFKASSVGTIPDIFLDDFMKWYEQQRKETK